MRARADANGQHARAGGAGRSELFVRSTAAETFVLLVGAVAILISVVVRVRTFHAMAIRPADSSLWFTAGFIQDVGIWAAIAVPVQWLARRAPRLAAFLVVLFAATHALLHLLFSELIIVLGHTLRLSDLVVGFRRSMLAGSIDRGTVLTLSVIALVLVAGVFAVRSAARRLRLKFSGRALAALVMLPIAITMLLRFVYDVASTANPFVTAAMMVAHAPSEPAAGAMPPRPARPITDVRRLASGTPERWLRDDYPLVRHVERGRLQLPPGVKPNIVILLLESLRAREVGVYGGAGGLTPAIDALARHGIVIDQAYAAGSRTPEGEIALWYGLLADPAGLVMPRRGNVALKGLPEHLRDAGWRQFLWLNGSDMTFYRNDEFYAQRGFDVADGTVFPPYAPRTGWGYSDRALVRYSLDVLKRADEPFAAMLLTTTNHHPFELPPDATEMTRQAAPPTALGQLAGRYTAPMAQTIAYTDDAVRLFFEGARNEPWFGRTIFIIAGDHGHAIPPAAGHVTPHELMELEHRVPLIFYSPLLPGGMVVRGPASQVDLMPTMLALLGLTGPAATIGSNLFSEEPRRGPVISWDSSPPRVTIRTSEWTWHGTPSDRGGFTNEMLFHRDDRRGVDNRVAARPDVSRDLRDLAAIYLEVYPWLISTGRASMPPQPSEPQT